MTDETSLLRSGLLDSTALFHLVEWIERRVGAPIDPTSLDLVSEWDTASRIVAFIQRRRGPGVGTGEDPPGSRPGGSNR
ncbi:MAG: hypothetical protein ACM3SU_13515 [Acidobacteriota bacterium]